MKKLFVMALAVAAMASCSKNEVFDVPEIADNPELININPFTGKQTRAADKSAFVSGDAFAVYATQGNNPTGFFLDGMTKPADNYKLTGSAWGWASVSNDHKWNAVTSYPAKFYAACPSQSLSNPANPNFQFTVDPKQETSIAMVDLLAASALRTTTGTGALSFPFDHILSKIDFNVTVDPKVKVYIQSLKVWNAGKTATYTFNAGSAGYWNSMTPAINESFGYMGVVNPATHIYKNNDEKIGLDPKHSLIMMPQVTAKCTFAPSSAWDSNCLTTGTYIEVVYRMTNIGGNDVVGYTDALVHPANTVVPKVEGGLWVKVGYAFEATWAPKTSYTYTIGLAGQTNSGGTLIDPNFKKDDGTDSGLPVINPEGKDPINPGDPIVNTDKTIDFNVSVNPWSVDIQGGVNVDDWGPEEEIPIG